MLPVRDHLHTRSAPVVNYAGLVLLRLMQKREPVEYDPWERLGPRTRRA